MDNTTNPTPQYNNHTDRENGLKDKIRNLSRRVRRMNSVRNTARWWRKQQAVWRGKQRIRRIKQRPFKEVVKTKHRFVIMDMETYKEKFSFQLSGLNIFVALGITIIVLLILNTLIIALTPLREFIPGYTNNEMVEQTYHNAAIIDSLEHRVIYQDWMINAIQDALNGKAMPSAGDMQRHSDSLATLGITPSAYTRSRADSLLRIYVEQEDNLYQVRETSPSTTSNSRNVSLTEQQVNKTIFFSPVQGHVVDSFSVFSHHYGVDVAGISNATINAIYGGTVIFANFTVETGYVIAVQHPGNVMSVYKHCSQLLRQEGDMVRAGEPLGYLGNSGELTSGPHLHFELWMNGKPIDPLQFVRF